MLSILELLMFEGVLIIPTYEDPFTELLPKSELDLVYDIVPITVPDKSLYAVPLIELLFVVTDNL